jgi:hypothetical protein
MPKDVTNGLKRGSVLQEMDSVRMAQAMRAVERNLQSALANHRLKSFRNGCGLQQADGSAHSEENSPMGYRWWRSPEVFYQCGQDFIREWEFQGCGSLALVDS